MTEAIISYIVTALKKVWCWFLGITADWGLWLWGIFKGWLPTMPDQSTGGLEEIIPIVNCWIPLDQAATLFAAWVALRLAITAYRFVKSWVPIGS